MKCTLCGTTVSSQDRYCPTCGYPCGKQERKNGKSKAGFVLTAVLTVLVLTLTVTGVVLFFLPQSSAPAVHTPPASISPTRPAAATEDPANDESLPAHENNVVEADYFRLTNGSLEFLPEKYTGEGLLTVPERIGGRKVIAIGSGCFRDCDMLNTIILPEGITSIGEGAFADCDKLRGVYLPETVTSIGAGAFRDCVNFEAAYIPGGVTEIEKDAFAGCVKLRFIFYNGYSSDWNNLYTEFVSPFTYVICLDTDLRQGAQTP